MQASKPAGKAKAGQVRDVVPGDYVFADHPERGPITLRVTASGKDGFRGVCEKDEKHGVPWGAYLGHKARVATRYDVVSQGVDGSIVRDENGHTKFLAGDTPQSPAPKESPTGAKPAPKNDDPLLGGLADMVKALDAPVVRVPANARLMLKAGPIANRPGLSLVASTDIDGTQTHRWKSTEKPAPAGDKKKAAEKPSKPAFKHGDTVQFQHGDVVGEGKIVGSGADGVTLQDADGREHQVRHEHLTGHGKPVAAKDGGSAPADGSDRIEPDKFSASAFFDKHNDAGATPDSVMANFPPEAAEKIKDVESLLAKVEPTDVTHKKDGAWTPERAALHDKIISKILTPEAIAAATPKDGEQPQFKILGGRGGSGKSWFDDKVYDKGHALLLDSDAIKKMLPEYKGWNAAQVNEESGAIFDEITRIAWEAGLNVVHDATMKTASKALALVKQFKEAGYHVEAHYMHLPRQEAAKRAVSRFLGPTGRYVPTGVVLSNTTNETSFDSIKPHVDAWSFRDNNVPKGHEPRLISEKKKDEVDPGKLGRSGLPADLGKHRDNGAASPEKVGGGAPRRAGGGFPSGYPGAYGAARNIEKASGGVSDATAWLLPASTMAKGLFAGAAAAGSISVNGHMRGGTYIAPFEVTRKKRMEDAEHAMAAKQVHAIHAKTDAGAAGAATPDADKIERWRVAVGHGDLHPDDYAAIVRHMHAEAEPRLMLKAPAAPGGMMKALRGAVVGLLFRRQVRQTKLA